MLKQYLVTAFNVKEGVKINKVIITYTHIVF